MKTRSRGFTLVEVLVALAIVAVALGAGLRAAGALTDNARRLGEVSAAQWCAENELANLRLARGFPGIGDAEFRCEQPSGFEALPVIRVAAFDADLGQAVKAHDEFLGASIVHPVGIDAGGQR